MPPDSDRSTLPDPFDSPIAPSSALPASRGARALALVGGLVVLVVASVATLGTALLALVGMAVAWGIARRRGRPLTRGAAWWGASLGVALGFAAFMAVTFVNRSPGTRARLQHGTDSLVAASPPVAPPAWLERIDPRGKKAVQASDSTAQRSVWSPALLAWLWMGAMFLTFMSALVGAVAGSLGWCVGMLLAFAATGTWLPGDGERLTETGSD